MKKVGLILFLIAIVLFIANFVIFWSGHAVSASGGWILFGQIVSSIITPLLIIVGLVLIVMGFILKK